MTDTPRPEWLATARRIAEANTENFTELVELAGLDPARDFRFADLSGIDFSGCDLRGFDFTGARLHGCTFVGTLLSGEMLGEDMPRDPANFAAAELGQVIHRFDRNTRGPAEPLPIADLTQAIDWVRFARPEPSTLLIETATDRILGSIPTSDSHLPTGAIFQDVPFGPQLVVIPAGEFWIGSPDGSGGDQGEVAEPGRDDNEGPRQHITIERRFALGRFAVTFEEYDAYAEATDIEKPKVEGWGRGRRPVINVSHQDAEKYADWLSELTGLRYRLPSEAEWEYACRAGTDTPFWWGDKIAPEQANYDGNFAYNDGATGEYRGQTVEVDAFDPNPWGLYQMHGNVWEWCADAWSIRHHGIPTDGSPRESADADVSRVLRGGSWYGSPEDLRSAIRDVIQPDLRYSVVGFRLARTLNP